LHKVGSKFAKPRFEFSDSNSASARRRHETAAIGKFMMEHFGRHSQGESSRSRLGFVPKLVFDDACRSAILGDVCFTSSKKCISMARWLLTDEDWALIADVFPSNGRAGAVD